MAKKPLGPEGARFKKADWNPQATGSKGTYISDRDALEARVAELEKVNGITVEVVTVKAEHLKGNGPYVVRYLVEDAQRIEHDFFKKADRALENLMRERVQAALESDDFGSLATLGKLPPVAVIKSADGECFVPMPTAGIVRPSLPDLSRVNEGDEIFKVQLDAELYDQDERAFAALGIAALDVAKSYRDAAQYTPEKVASLEANVNSLAAERDRLRDQIAKDKNRVANANVVETKLGGFAITAAIGWIAAIGLYIYSDLPIPFVGGASSDTRLACANTLVGQNGGAIPTAPQFTFLSNGGPYVGSDNWFAFADRLTSSDDIEISSIKLGPSANGVAGGTLRAQIMNRSTQPIGNFVAAAEIAKMSDNSCEHGAFQNANEYSGRVIQPGTSGEIVFVYDSITYPYDDQGVAVWLSYGTPSARPSER